MANRSKYDVEIFLIQNLVSLLPNLNSDQIQRCVIDNNFNGILLKDIKVILRSLHSAYPEKKHILMIERNKNELLIQLHNFFNSLKNDNNIDLRPFSKQSGVVNTNINSNITLMNNSNTNNNVNTNVKSNITSLNNNNINNNNLNNNNNGNFNNGSNKKKTVSSVNPWSNGEDDEDLDRLGLSAEIKKPNKKAKSNNNPTLSCPPSINTPKKMHFFNILVGQYNIPQHEVVRAIESIGDGPDIDLDIILGIIMSMQVLDDDERNKRLLEEEENMMTQAILNSESEREVIEKRKRDRVTSLKIDIDVSIVEAIEFKQSILLGRYNNNSSNESSSSSSSSSSNSSSSSSSSNSSSNSSYCGSTRIKEMLKIVEDNTTIVNDCSKLRLALVNLLLLESQALKFHAENSYSYLNDLCVRFDNLLSGIKANTDGCDKYIHYANHEAEKLSDILYLLPEDGGQIPLAFRNTNEKIYNIEDDGLELIAAVDNNNNNNNADDADY